MPDISTTIREFLTSELLDHDAKLGDETPLLETELVDSMGVLTLVGFLEEEYGVMISAEEVSAENFASIRSITRLLEAKL